MSPGETTTSSGLRERLHVVRRRKWLFLLPILVVPAAALLYSFHQPKEFAASSDVLLGQQSSISDLTGTTNNLSSSSDPQRIVDTLTALAREPQLASRALERAHLRGRTAEELLRQVSVSAGTGTNLLTFQVTDRNQRLAVRLANAYGAAFADFVVASDTSALRAALTRVQHRMAELGPNHSTPLYNSLATTEEQIQTQLALQTANAAVVRVADHAHQVAPQPVRNGLLGLVLGIALGFGLVFLRDALDTRVKSADEVGSILHLPLLARVPTPPRGLRSRGRLVMIADPAGKHAEPFRVLRTNLEFVTMERNARTILVTSALEEEGKSTTASNLAIALARQGKSVVLVDLDLRRPRIHRFFDTEERPGITDVALGRVALAKALVPVAVSSSALIPTSTEKSKTVQVIRTGAETTDTDDDSWLAIPEEPGESLPDVAERTVAGNGHAKTFALSTLSILRAGQVPPDPGEFVSSAAVRRILQTLAKHADFVIVDSPPLLTVGDALAISAEVDGIVIVTRLDVVHRRTLGELHRVLEAAPAKTLGFVATGSDAHDDYAYGYGYGHSHTTTA